MGKVPQFKTYRFYNGSKQRLAIFGEVNGDKLEITIAKCSRKDNFDKKAIYVAYSTGTNKINDEEVHYTTDSVKLENVNKPYSQFMKYVNENFYRVIFETKLVAIEQTKVYLVKGGRKKKFGKTQNVEFSELTPVSIESEA